MMNLSCDHCGKEGTLEEEVYSGKRLRLQCPYCSGSFIFKVPGNGKVTSPLSLAAAVAAAPSQTVAIFEEPTASVPAAAEPALAESEPVVATDKVEEQAEVAVPPPPEPEVDEALVHEAKRIARLIISEVKLYNQDKIARAKNKREVLELLKNDLIRGKQHYNTRIASKLPSGPDYFMETVKEILLAGKS